MTRDEIVAEARRWIGTPFLHQGKLCGVGVDCAGVVEMVPKRLGAYKQAVIEPYQARPNPVKMRAALDEHLKRIAWREVLPADILWFRGVEPQHLGIVTSLNPLRMVHASNRRRVMRVVEEDIGEHWQRKLAGCYRYRGLE